jgi:hypothetical protein
MLNKITTVVVSLFFWLALVLPAGAQGAPFDLSGLNAATSGSLGNTTYKTGQGPSGPIYAPSSNPTSQQIPGTLPQTTMAGLAPVFGGGGYGGGGYGWSGYGSGGGYGGSGGAVPPGALSSFSSTLPGSTFSQHHPLRTQVLVGDSNLYNQINADYGNLGGQYPNLVNQAQSIENQEESDAAANGGVITYSEQAQLDQQENGLGQQVAAASTTGF